jgi:hypothetical protein
MGAEPRAGAKRDKEGVREGASASAWESSSPAAPAARRCRLEGPARPPAGSVSSDVSVAPKVSAVVAALRSAGGQYGYGAGPARHGVASREEGEAEARRSAERVQWTTGRGEQLMQPEEKEAEAETRREEPVAKSEGQAIDMAGTVKSQQPPQIRRSTAQRATNEDERAKGGEQRGKSKEQRAKSEGARNNLQRASSTEPLAV